MATKTKCNGLSDSDRDNVIVKAAKWREAVGRRDVTVKYAAEQVAGDVTYPYASESRFVAVRRYAASLLQHCVNDTETV